MTNKKQVITIEQAKETLKEAGFIMHFWTTEDIKNCADER